METVTDIIDLWPSAVALASDLGENVVTVRSWKRRNSIPGEKWLEIVNAAGKRSIHGVTLERLARIADARSRFSSPLRRQTSEPSAAPAELHEHTA